jgi:hypothetical protein
MRGVDIVVASQAHTAEDRAALTTTATGRYPTASTTDCFDGASPRRIGSLVVTPASGDGAVVVIGAFGSARPEDCTAAHFAAECIVARRRFSFVGHRSVELPIVLDPSCAGVPCDESSTCEGKRCVDSQVHCVEGACSAPGALADGGVVAVDASPVVDASLPDVGPVLLDAANDGPVAITEAGPPDANITTGICPILPNCLDGTRCAATQVCCYQTGTTSCTADGVCPQVTACCRGAEDCNSGEVCCRTSTDNLIACHKESDCILPYYCSTAAPGCGTRNPCMTGSPPPIPQQPNFFACS